MEKTNIHKPFNLEDRTFVFARDVRFALNQLKKTDYNKDDIRQVIRSSGSIGANYIEANEGLSKKDLLFRLKFSRKEAKETHYWLRLLEQTNHFNEEKTINSLIQESFELVKIFSSIIEKVK